MKSARLQISWGPSISSDVVGYRVLVIDEGTQEVLKDVNVSFAETQVLVDVKQNTNITATVTAYDALFDSVPVSTSYSVGDLTPPTPATFVVVDMVEILEEQVDDETIDDPETDTVEGGESDDSETVEDDTDDETVDEDGADTV